MYLGEKFGWEMGFSVFSGSCLQDMNVFLSPVVLRYLGMLEHSLFPVHGVHGKEIYFPRGQITKLKKHSEGSLKDPEWRGYLLQLRITAWRRACSRDTK